MDADWLRVEESQMTTQHDLLAGHLHRLLPLLHSDHLLAVVLVPNVLPTGRFVLFPTNCLPASKPLLRSALVVLHPAKRLHRATVVSPSRCYCGPLCVLTIAASQCVRHSKHAATYLTATAESRKRRKKIAEALEKKSLHN